MRLLLDTHVVLWALGGNPRLKESVRAAIAEPANAVYVSAATAWELAIKAAIGKAKFPERVDQWLPVELARSRFQELPVTVRHAAAVESLPAHHNDPFDRLLVAQARIEGLILVTADRVLRRYQVKLLRA